MKHTEVVQVPATTRERTVRVECDICGGHVPTDGIYTVNENVVSRRSGESYPEGSSGTKVFVDLCDDCFEGKLIPWLRSQNANIQTEEWDY